MTESSTNGRGGKVSPAKSWARALELTAPIARHPHRIFPKVIEEQAARFGEAPALLSERECLTYRGLAARANQYSRWALGQELGKGDCVGLLMPNRPEFMAVWLGITQVGGVVALLNTNLTGASLAHSIRVAGPKHLIVAAELIDSLAAALGELAAPRSSGSTARPAISNNNWSNAAERAWVKTSAGQSALRIGHSTSIRPAPPGCPKPPP